MIGAVLWYAEHASKIRHFHHIVREVSSEINGGVFASVGSEYPGFVMIVKEYIVSDFISNCIKEFHKDTLAYDVDVSLENILQELKNATENILKELDHTSYRWKECKKPDNAQFFERQLKNIVDLIDRIRKEFEDAILSDEHVRDRLIANMLNNNLNIIPGTNSSSNKNKAKLVKPLFFKKRPHLIVVIIIAVMLLGALGHWPYGYYQLLRFAVCGVSVFLVSVWERSWVRLLFGFIAILFNPILPIHLSRELWQIIDLALSVLFFIVGFIPIPLNIDANQKNRITSLNAGEGFESVHTNSPVDDGNSKDPNNGHQEPMYLDFG